MIKSRSLLFFTWQCAVPNYFRSVTIATRLARLRTVGSPSVTCLRKYCKPGISYRQSCLRNLVDQIFITSGLVQLFSAGSMRWVETLIQTGEFSCLISFYVHSNPFIIVVNFQIVKWPAVIDARLINPKNNSQIVSYLFPLLFFFTDWGLNFLN